MCEGYQQTGARWHTAWMTRLALDGRPPWQDRSINRLSSITCFITSSSPSAYIMTMPIQSSHTAILPCMNTNVWIHLKRCLSIHHLSSLVLQKFSPLWLLSGSLICPRGCGNSHCLLFQAVVKHAEREDMMQREKERLEEVVQNLEEIIWVTLGVGGNVRVASMQRCIHTMLLSWELGAVISDNRV